MSKKTPGEAVHIDALEGALNAVMRLAAGDDALHGQVIDALHRGAHGG